MRGWLSYISASKKLSREVAGYARLKKLLVAYRAREVLDFHDAASRQLEQLRRMRLGVGTMDLKIAAIALCHDATVITQNTIDFSRIPNLRVEDWTR